MCLELEALWSSPSDQPSVAAPDTALRSDVVHTTYKCGKGLRELPGRCFIKRAPQQPGSAPALAHLSVSLPTKGSLVCHLQSAGSQNRFAAVSGSGNHRNGSRPASCLFSEMTQDGRLKMAICSRKGIGV